MFQLVGYWHSSCADRGTKCPAKPVIGAKSSAAEFFDACKKNRWLRMVSSITHWNLLPHAHRGFLRTSTHNAKMEFVFVKGAGKFDRLDITHADGRMESIDCPKQRIIPHDMVHYAVESTLDKRGFLRRVCEGERAVFGMAANAESDSVERLVEVFQGDGWSGGGSPAADMIDLYRVTCTARACPALPIQCNDIEAVRERIAVLTAQWDKLAVGESLTLVW